MTLRQVTSEHDVSGQGQDVANSPWPWVMLAGTVAWSLWELRATVISAAYSNDSSLHEQMVQFATAQLRAGHDPLTSWFPYLGLGSPQFLHYQSVPAMVTGLAGLLAGPGTSFRWSLYLLWCLWPVAIYCSARLFGLRPVAAAVAAVVAPLLHSAPGIGYEQSAYLWAGFGVWTQLWGSWALPFAWALSWRAMTDKRFLAPAAGSVALTAALHYETGYLAFAAIGIMPFLDRLDIKARLARAAGLLVTALLASAWVVVPLLVFSRWAAINQALAGTPMTNGYGARTVLGWLVTGKVFDDGRLPVVTLLVAAGLAVVVLGWQRAGERQGPDPGHQPKTIMVNGSLTTQEPGQRPIHHDQLRGGRARRLPGREAGQLPGREAGQLPGREAGQLRGREAGRLRGRGAGRGIGGTAGAGRALAVLLAVCLVLSFGRTTFGSLVSVIPGSSDLFFRRFLMGAQLAGIYLAGLGAAEILERIPRLARWPQWATVAVLTAVAVAYLYPAWRSLASYDSLNSADIQFQQLAQDDEQQVAAVATVIREHGPGRAYAGSPQNWGQYFTVGLVPVYTYLTSLDVDMVGDTLRTASLMTQPEYHFDPDNPGNYPLFGIRYLILPGLKTPQPVPPGAVLILRENLLRVYELPGSSYIRVADTVGSIVANRADVGSQTIGYLRDGMPGQDRYLGVSWAGGRAAAPTLPPPASAAGPAGTVVAEHVDLADGSADAVVRLRRRAVVVLSTSFDPGWSVTIDGRPASTQMVAPALVAVTVPPGSHNIAFQYRGFGWYPELLALAAVALAAAALTARRWRRPRLGRAGNR
jgi:hypothetical protein